MLIIMLGGQARVGKTTLAKWLSEFAYNNGYSPVILPFAAALKDEAAARGYSKDTNPLEYREFCQTLGSTKRAEDPDYWVKRFRDKVRELYAAEEKALKDDPDTWHEKVIIVDDCRYLNEVAAARDLQALTIFITPHNRQLVEHNAEWRTHESEAMAIEVDRGNKDYRELFHYIIKNELTEEAFKTKCGERFEEWFHVTSEAMLDSLCECELCVSYREDREPDGDKIYKEIVDMLDNPNKEPDAKSKRKPT